MEVPGGGRALNGLGAPPGCQNQSNSEYSDPIISAIRQWAIRFIAERATAQTDS